MPAPMHDDDVLDAVERWHGAPIASGLREFVAAHGGRAIGEVRLYAADEWIERNECYETPVYCPGWLALGDDGGGRAIMVHAALTPPTVFVVGHGSMSEADFRRVGEDLALWVAGGCGVD